MTIKLSTYGLVLQMLCLGVLFAFDSKAQYKSINDTYIEVSQGDITIGELINIIEQGTDFSFFYVEKDFDKDQSISLREGGKKSISNILLEISKTSRLKFRQVNNNISITPITRSEVKSEEDVIQVILSEVTVVGKVISGDDQQPLPGINVVLKGTSIGTVTDVNGEYSITVPDDNSTLVFSSVGYVTEEVAVGSRTVIDIQLVPDITALEEIVVVGYGVQKKANLTGAVSTIGIEVIENRPVSGVAQALQGVVPGLVVTRRSVGGKPGVGLQMNIRGAGSPYVLIDGIEGSLDNLNLADIESITVLKDAASAAIYGANAAYGVVLVTTKQGNSGTEVNYSNNFSFSAPTKIPNQANSYAYAKYFNEASVNSGGVPLVSDEILEKIQRYINVGDIEGTSPSPIDPTRWGNTEYANANTDWFDFHIKDWASQETHNLSASGASEKTNYFISGSHLSQEGLLEFGDDGFVKKTINSRVDSEVYDWLIAYSNMKYSRREVDMPTFLNMNWNMFHRIAQARWPTNPVKDPNGHYMRVSDVAAIQEGGRTIDINSNFTSSIGLKIEPVEDWVTEIAYDWTISTWEQKEHQNYEFVYYGVDEQEFIYGNREDSKYVTYTGRQGYISPKVFSTYSKSINSHNFKIMGGFQQAKTEYSNHYVSIKNLQTPSMPSIKIGSGELQGSENKGHFATRSFFGRFNYDYMEKYLLEINWRADGSSYFEKGRRWGSFPSISLGYNIVKEDFWKPYIDYISNFKLRSSYGSLGNQTSYPYAYLETYSISSNLAWIMDGNIRPNYVGMPTVPSPNLTWETVSMLTFGLDAGFLQNRLLTTFDWYKRERIDILGPTDTPPATYGGNVPLTNNVEIETKGFELTVGWHDEIGDFSYNTLATLTNYKSVYKKYNNFTRSIWSNYEGKELGTIWGFTSNGLFQSEKEIEDGWDLSEISNEKWYPGDVKYEDLDGDGKISRGKATLDDHGDLSIIGNWVPKYQYGFSAGFSWKNIDFSMFWQGVGKMDVWLNGNFFFGSANGRWGTTVFEEHLDYWKEDNRDAYYPRPYLTQAGVDKNQQVSTRYLQNGAYLRLKNVQLAYTLSSSILSKFNVKKAKVYVSTENVLTFTKLSKIFDPETLTGMNNSTSGKTYPIQKEVSLGLSLTF